MDGLRSGKRVIQAINYPDRKRPSLVIFEEPNRYVKVATFNSEESAEAFMKYLFAMVGLEKEGISECSGCKYHELDPKEFPCYECRRNYYDKYEEEGYEEE